MQSFAKETTHFQTPLPFYPNGAARDCPLATIPEMVSFGDQDILAHKFVDNDFSSSNTSEIYMRPYLQQEPYTTSLYQTPYDQTQNLISTGTIVDPYSGQISEVFENQLPPPNTNKGAMLRRTLDHVNPRLVQLHGGYDPNNPPPPRVEHSTEIFNPVNPLGGKSIFGSKPIDDQIVKNQRQLASRDVYNNRNGNYAVQSQIGREQPWGYRGFQPMYEFVPQLTGTQELDLKGRNYGANPTPTDLTKREDFQGEFFSRKSHVLVTRDPQPTNLVNGIEAVSLIPIASELSNKQSNVQTYITSAFHDSANLVLPLSDQRVGHLSTTNPVNHFHNESVQPTLTPVDENVRSKLNIHQTNPLIGLAGPSGNLVVNSNSFVSNVRKLDEPLPVQSSMIPIGDLIIPNQSQPTNKNALQALPIGSSHLNAGTVLLPNELRQVKESIGILPISNPVLPQGDILNPLPIETHKRNLNPLPVTQANLTNFGNVIINEDLKTSKSTHTFAVQNAHEQSTGQILVGNNLNVFKKQNMLPINAGGFDQNSNVIVSQQSVPNTKKLLGHFQLGEAHMEHKGDVIVSQTMPKAGSAILQETLPIGAINGVNDASYVHVDVSTKDTKRMFNPIQSYLSGPTTNFGNILPLSNHVMNQYRGTEQNDYITSDSRIPVDAGMQTKIIGHVRDNKMIKKAINTAAYLNQRDNNYCPSPKIIPTAKITKRALQEYNNEMQAL